MPQPNAEEDPGPAKKRAIKWVDEKEGRTEEEQKKGLVTNKSSEDLNLKPTDDLKAIQTHKDPSKQTGIKKTIKTFNLDIIYVKILYKI